MGNLNNQNWEEIWDSPQAKEICAKVKTCDRNCWMIGSVSPAMKKQIWKPAYWVMIHKGRQLLGKKPYSMFENPVCQDLRDGRITEQQLNERTAV